MQPSRRTFMSMLSAAAAFAVMPRLSLGRPTEPVTQPFTPVVLDPGYGGWQELRYATGFPSIDGNRGLKPGDIITVVGSPVATRNVFHHMMTFQKHRTYCVPIESSLKGLKYGLLSDKYLKIQDAMNDPSISLADAKDFPRFTARLQQLCAKHELVGFTMFETGPFFTSQVERFKAGKSVTPLPRQAFVSAIMMHCEGDQITVLKNRYGRQCSFSLDSRAGKLVESHGSVKFI